MTTAHRAEQLFRDTFDSGPAVTVRAPGRVNLIGEHTDYNDGFVLPMAIDADLVIAAAPRGDRAVHVVSESQPEAASFSLDSLERGSGWVEYLKGVAAELDDDGVLGWNGAIVSDIPDGAGLSSSAAIELATARVFAELSGLAWDPVSMALVGQRAENSWVGMNSGVMDQLVCATGRAGYARLIDCRDLTGLDVPLIDEVAVVLLDTGTRRSLIDSEYNVRRSDCEAAAKLLGVESLRDATLETIALAGLDERLERRARHVITENARTIAAAGVLRSGDAPALGDLMDESHASLRDDFEVSSSALDAMARVARSMPGCFGARQTGGGFAGSCIALVETSMVSRFIEAVASDYRAATGHRGSSRIVTAANGVETVSLA